MEEIKKIKETKTNIFISIKNVTRNTTKAYKKNIDSSLGLLSYILFSKAGMGIYNLEQVGFGAILAIIFDLFCAITLIIAKKRVSKGNLSKYFDTTQDNKSQELNDFFVDDSDDESENIKVID